jgi:hypothetical protein
VKFYPLIAVAAALLTSACGGPEKDTLPVGQSLAVQRLQVERRVVNGTGLGSLTLHTNGGDENSINLVVERAGSPQSFACVVLIEAVSEKESSGQVDCSKSDGPKTGKTKKARDMMAVVVREHVRATIAKVPYDTAKVADAMMSMIVGF